ncbi:hypothetical protein QE152_g4419 [Popillia japonica]|uniref:Uncharacterized protein n=1 Tax=Popillia japonica TaxID=7064 RepID=A0AAW1MV29_POPJA
MKAELQDGAPPGTMIACHPSGWMQSDIFLQWFDHFLAHAKPSVADPVDPQDQTEAGQEYLQPGPSSRSQPDPPSSPQPGTSSSSQTSFAVSPKDIIPLPKTKVVKKETKRKKGTAAVLIVFTVMNCIHVQKIVKDG